MPTLPPGTQVAIRPDTLRRLAFPPSKEAVLLIAIHPVGLRAPGSVHTQVVGFDAGDLCWAGALGEDRLEVVSDDGGNPRQLLGEAIGSGDRYGDIIWPGELLLDPRPDSASTIYQRERPWVVLGRVPQGDLLAAPLNDAGNPKWYTPLVGREEVLIHNSTKDAQLELAHLWSFPASEGRLGTLTPGARDRIMAALRSYF